MHTPTNGQSWAVGADPSQVGSSIRWLAQIGKPARSICARVLLAVCAIAQCGAPRSDKLEFLS
jgi:hypothetical protein